MNKHYEQARQTYWDQQSAFREIAIAEIQRLIPDGYTAAHFEFNDADPPRLSLVRLVAQDGTFAYFEEDLPEQAQAGPEGLFDAIDQVAWDMEFAHWDEATSRLFRTEDNAYLIIERNPS